MCIADDLCLSTGKVNQLGGTFFNGKALPLCVRQKIIELAESGIRPCEISRQLRVSHACISKLLAKYNETGSFEPGRARRKSSRDVSKEIRSKIKEYKRLNPSIFSWELKDKLLAEGVCNKEGLPPLPVISRISREMSRWYNSESSSDTSGSNCSTNCQQMENESEQRISAFSFDNILRLSASGNPQHQRNDSSNKAKISYKRRKRTKFTREQTDVLEMAYEKMRYPDVLTREELAERLNVPEYRIQVWFSNHRSKDKRNRQQYGHEQRAVQEPTLSRSRVYMPIFKPVPLTRYDVCAPACNYSSLPYWQAILGETDTTTPCTLLVTNTNADRHSLVY